MTLKDTTGTIKPIALVLPQFHPIPENNLWWGEGFTEWTNVVKGKPRFQGHYQPHLPKDLGYYDLRLPEARQAQADLAKQYGIYGFCYYHYWFNGRRILEKPVDAILESGQPDFPFMLCWANENWSRNWDGGFKKVLLEQNYSKEDFINHARHLVRYFRDPRYIRIDGKPVFAIYKDGIGDRLEEYIQAFRDELRAHSIEVFLCRFERRIGTTENLEKAFRIFDAGIEFQPLTRQFARVKEVGTLASKLKKFHLPLLARILQKLHPTDSIYRYRDVVENDLGYDFQQGRPIFPGVCPGWDNSARRPAGSALILDGSTPELFETWIRHKIDLTDWDLLPERFLFVNAWNEWAEGNHLEPCERWGTQYLSALQQAVHGI
jgi:lipopolysaccharide biosynthesis protein